MNPDKESLGRLEEEPLIVFRAVRDDSGEVLGVLSGVLDSGKVTLACPIVPLCLACSEWPELWCLFKGVLSLALWPSALMGESELTRPSFTEPDGGAMAVVSTQDSLLPSARLPDFIIFILRGTWSLGRLSSPSKVDLRVGVRGLIHSEPIFRRSKAGPGFLHECSETGIFSVVGMVATPTFSWTSHWPLGVDVSKGL